MTAAPPGDAARPEDDGPVVLSTGRYDSFVLRVFSRNRTGELVHGEVTHVPTRRKQRFTDWRNAMAFMLAHIGSRPTGPNVARLDPSPAEYEASDD